MNPLRSVCFSARRTLLLGLVACLPASVSLAQGVVNEGSGSRRESLDRMIFQPAPLADVLTGDEWIGETPTLASLSGRPILIFSWAEWYRPSHTVAMLAQRLAGEFDDLAVIGIHDAEGWDEAKTFAERRKLSFPIVHDASGSIRSALKIDQDPDVFVVDRAGQMRYADITTESIRIAVAEVAGEDTEAASGVEARLAGQRAEVERASRSSRGINKSVAFDGTLNVPFAKPTAEEYAATAWPKKDTSDEDRRRNRRGNDGPVSVPEFSEGWFRDRAPSSDGRVRVVYLWHPVYRDSMDDLMIKMDALQRRMARDVVVEGALVPVADQRRRSNEPEDPMRSLPIDTNTIERFIGGRQLDHYLVAASGSPLPPLDGQRTRDQLSLLGSVGVVSTDGILRRLEHFTNWDEFRRALDTTLRVDPGVKARREAEDAFIRAGG